MKVIKTDTPIKSELTLLWYIRPINRLIYFIPNRWKLILRHPSFTIFMPNHNSMQKFLLHFPSRTIIAHNLYALFIERYFCFMGYYLKHECNTISTAYSYLDLMPTKITFQLLKNPVSTSTFIVKSDFYVLFSYKIKQLEKYVTKNWNIWVYIFCTFS